MRRDEGVEGALRPVGTQAFLQQEYGLTAEHILEAAGQLLAR